MISKPRTLIAANLNGVTVVAKSGYKWQKVEKKVVKSEEKWIKLGKVAKSSEKWEKIGKSG